jgi:hypothetical protein
MFKKALVPALVLAAASVAVPAAAQSYHGPARGPAYSVNHGGWQSINQRKYNLDRRIDQGVRNRTLSAREARNLRTQLNSLVRLEMTYQRRGLTLRERQDLDRRYDRLSRQVRVDRHDYKGRPGRR